MSDFDSNSAGRADLRTRDGALADAATTPIYASSALMAEHAEIRIVHAGITYRLRRTATNKLILTK